MNEPRIILFNKDIPMNPLPDPLTEGVYNKNQHCVKEHFFGPPTIHLRSVRNQQNPKEHFLHLKVQTNPNPHLQPFYVVRKHSR